MPTDTAQRSSQRATPTNSYSVSALRRDWCLQHWGLQHCAMAYINDILIYSKTRGDNIRYLRQVIMALKQAGLVVNRKKSSLGHTSVQYLGFNLEGGKVWSMQESRSFGQNTPAYHPDRALTLSKSCQLLPMLRAPLCLNCVSLDRPAKRGEREVNLSP